MDSVQWTSVAQTFSTRGTHKVAAAANVATDASGVAGRNLNNGVEIVGIVWKGWRQRSKVRDDDWLLLQWSTNDERIHRIIPL